jgi:hypothetical protein
MGPPSTCRPASCGGQAAVRFRFIRAGVARQGMHLAHAPTGSSRPLSPLWCSWNRIRFPQDTPHRLWVWVHRRPVRTDVFSERMVVGPRELATVTRRDKWQPLAAMRVAQINEPFSKDMRPIGKHLPIQHAEKGRIVRGRAVQVQKHVHAPLLPQPLHKGLHGAGLLPVGESDQFRSSNQAQLYPLSEQVSLTQPFRRNSKQPNRWRRGSKCHKCANGWSPPASGGAGEIQRNPRRGSCVGRRSVQWSCAHKDRAWCRAAGPWHTRN